MCLALPNSVYVSIYCLFSIMSIKMAEGQENSVAAKRTDPGARLPVFALALANLDNLLNLFVPQASPL